MSYRVEFEPRAWDEMALPEKMKGEENAYRIRVGDYRIVYEIHDTVLLVVVFTVGHRREVYRK